MHSDRYSSHSVFQTGLAFLILSLVLNGLVMVVSFIFPTMSDRAYSVLSLVLELGMAVPFFILMARGRISGHAFFDTRHVALDLLLGMVAGFAGMMAITMVNLVVEIACQVLGMVPVGGEVESVGTTWLDFALNFTGIAFSAAVGEELLMRGTVFPALSRRMGVMGAMLVSSALFAVLHGSPSSMPYTFVAGILLCLLFVVSGNLWAPMAFHFTMNGYAVIVTFITENLDRLVGNIPELEGLSPEALDEAEAILSELPSLIGYTVSYIPTFLGTSAVFGLILFLLKKVHKGVMYVPEPELRREVAGWILLAAGVLVCVPRFVASLLMMLGVLA